MTQNIVPFGSWPSPITSEWLVSGAVGINEVVVDGDDIWVAESRPQESGRTALLRYRAGESEPAEITPADVDVRTRVHEYGGGAWWVEDGLLVFSNDADQRMWKLDTSTLATPLALTPEPPRDASLRYADARITPDGRAVVCVREEHAAEPGALPSNTLVSIPTDGTGEVTVLVDGADFVSSPRVSPDGSRLAWIQWNLPDMPWDGTELWLADLTEDATELRNARRVSGDRDTALAMPVWAPDTTLWVTSDHEGWNNLYRITDLQSPSLEGAVTGEFEIATPHWVFGLSRVVLTGAGELWFAQSSAGGDRLGYWATPGDPATRPVLVDTGVGGGTITSLRATASGAAVAVVGRHDREREVVSFTPDGAATVMHGARPLDLPPEMLSPPEAITFPTTDNAVAHALLYPPAHDAVKGPESDLPPLLVRAHGGPTSAARNELILDTRYWTSRGWAVVDVDYRGSTGYGREYMRALDGQWGLADVDDCVAAATFLADRGDVDPRRLAIRGGSAGGFTVLAALVRHDTFTAGATRYGVSDLTALAADTHKFESRYLDRLVGRWPEDEAIYRDRSPINHTDKLSCPMIVLQGGADAVVPPNQAEMLVNALEAKGLPYEYLVFPEEGHGFRRGENIVAAIEAEEAFFASQFGYELPGATS